MYIIFSFKKYFLYYLVFLIFISLWLFACRSSRESAEYPPGTFSLAGVMQFLPIETGCWQLVSDDGEHYELMGEEVVPLQKDGIRVKLLVNNVEGVSSTCMAGKIVKLIEIVEINE